MLKPCAVSGNSTRCYKPRIDSAVATTNLKRPLMHPLERIEKQTINNRCSQSQQPKRRSRSIAKLAKPTKTNLNSVLLFTRLVPRVRSSAGVSDSPL